MVRIYRSSGVGDGLKPSHTGADLGEHGRGIEAAWARRWLSAAKFMVAPLIILVVATLLFPAIIRARKPTLEAKCMSKLKQVSVAILMYAQDHGNYPPSPDWHNAIRGYIDDPLDPHGRVLPGTALDPLKCPSDPTQSTVSYLYLNRNLLDYSKAHLSEAIVPQCVDEYFHEHVTLCYYDGHTEKIEKQLWLHMRNRQWEIRRDLDNPGSFAYEPLPGSIHGPVGHEPYMDRSTMYIWPKF